MISILWNDPYEHLSLVKEMILKSDLSMLVASYTCFGLVHLSTTLTESKSLRIEFSKATCEACHREKRGNKWKASRRGTEKACKGGVKGGSQTHSSLSPAAWLRCSSVEIHCYLETRTQYTLINYPQAHISNSDFTRETVAISTRTFHIPKTSTVPTQIQFENIDVFICICGSRKTFNILSLLKRFLVGTCSVDL